MSQSFILLNEGQLKRLGELQSNPKFYPLGQYNWEISHGIKHTKQYKKTMKFLQEEYNNLYKEVLNI